MTEHQPRREQLRRAGPVMQWFEQRAATATLQIDSLPLNQIEPGWQHTGEMITNLAHDGTPRLYTVEGHMVYPKGKNEVGYTQPGIVEVPDPSDPDKACGTVGLLVDKKTGNVLLQFGVEPFQAAPGEPEDEYATLRPSLQGSYTNLVENRVPLSDDVEPEAYTHFVRSNPNRIRGKVRLGVTKVDAEQIDLSDKPNHQWFSLKEADEALLEGVPMNAFLQAALNLHKAQLSQKTSQQ